MNRLPVLQLHKANTSAPLSIAVLSAPVLTRTVLYDIEEEGKGPPLLHDATDGKGGSISVDEILKQLKLDGERGRSAPDLMARIGIPMQQAERREPLNLKR